MQIKVEAVTKEPRVFNNQVQWGVKLPDNTWVTLYREAKPNKGDTLEVNITERRGKDGKTYRDAFPVMPPLAPELPAKDGAKVPTWDEWRALKKASHNLALVLEPDDIDEAGVIRTDKSTARAALVNTDMIAYSNGKFTVPAEDDDYVPPPEDEGVPF